MILWFVLLMFQPRLHRFGAAAEHKDLERIETCSTRCSQGLQCKTSPGALFPPPCRSPSIRLNTSSVFHNISLSTVMSCERRQKCFLHLRTRAGIQLTGSIHGLSVCTTTPGTLANCQIFSISRSSRQQMSGLQVEIENDCTDISPNQQVEVTMTTLPNYCGVTWTGTYHVPGCNSEALRRHVPECITGRLSYDVDPDRKELRVTVTDMLEGHNYLLRLCRNNFICTGTGAATQITKDQPLAIATLKYTRPLPCLCIQGWSAVMDAPRVQVCPFKDNVEELWLGVAFDPLEETLSWEPACPVAAVVTLCRQGEDGVCVDLPHATQNVSREKITFARVDPHPELCMKFSAGLQSWTRCPFADGRFQVWEVTDTQRSGRTEVKVFSQVNATFSVGLCVTSAGSPACQPTETQDVYVEEHRSMAVKLSGELCQGNVCVIVRRLDVKFAAAVFRCSERSSKSSSPGSALDSTWVVVPTSVCVCGVILSALLLYVLLRACQRRKQRRTGGYFTPEKHTDSALEGVSAMSQTQPALSRGVVTLETDILLSD